MCLFLRQEVNPTGVGNIFHLPSCLSVPNPLLQDERIDGWMEDEWMN